MNTGKRFCHDNKEHFVSAAKNFAAANERFVGAIKNR